MPNKLKIASKKLPSLYSVKIGWRISIKMPSKNDIDADNKKGLTKYNSSLNVFIKLKVSKKYKKKCPILSWCLNSGSLSEIAKG